MDIPTEGPVASQAWLQLLGSPRLTLPDGQARPLRPNHAVLLALLALRGPLPSAWLAPLIYPDPQLGKSINNLRQRVHQFNKSLRFEVVAGMDQQRELGAGVAHELSDPLTTLRADPRALRGPLLGTQTYADRPELAEAVDAERQRWRLRLRDALVQVAHEHEAAERIALALPCALRPAPRRGRPAKRTCGATADAPAPPAWRQGRSAGRF